MTILTMYHLSRNARRRAENRAGASQLIFFVSQNITAVSPKLLFWCWVYLRKVVQNPTLIKNSGSSNPIAIKIFQ